MLPDSFPSLFMCSIRSVFAGCCSPVEDYLGRRYAQLGPLWVSESVGCGSCTFCRSPPSPEPDPLPSHRPPPFPSSSPPPAFLANGGGVRVCLWSHSLSMMPAWLMSSHMKFLLFASTSAGTPSRTLGVFVCVPVGKGNKRESGSHGVTRPGLNKKGKRRLPGRSCCTSRRTLPLGAASPPFKPRECSAPPGPRP